jgi:hypothetical protein
MAGQKPIPAALTLQELSDSPVLRASTERRLLDRVSRAESGCWEWQGRLGSSGYGSCCFVVRGKNFAAHRAAFLLFCGPLLKGLEVCHHCDNRRCVRPDHLFQGTRTDNMRDCSSKGRHWMQKTPHLSTLSRLSPEQKWSRGRGERNGNAKVTAEIVRQIRQMAADGKTSHEIARVTGLHNGHVRAIVRKKWWTHVE